MPETPRIPSFSAHTAFWQNPARGDGGLKRALAESRCGGGREWGGCSAIEEASRQGCEAARNAEDGAQSPDPSSAWTQVSRCIACANSYPRARIVETDRVQTPIDGR